MSIDVAIGSIGSSVLAVKALEVKMPVMYWLILPLCVWLIYTSDHLLDAIKVKDRASMGRHYFHFVYMKTIGICLVLIGIVSSLLIYNYLDLWTVVFGFSVGLLIVTYLLVNHFFSWIFRYFPREFFIAAGYIAGTWGLPLLTKYPYISRSEAMLFAGNFLIILSIPLLYSIYEYDADKLAGFVSFASGYGIKITQFLVAGLLTMSAILSVWTVLFLQHSIGIVMLIMAMILFAVLFFRKQLSKNEQYRSFADSITLLPFLLLI